MKEIFYRSSFHFLNFAIMKKAGMISRGDFTERGSFLKILVTIKITSIVQVTEPFLHESSYWIKIQVP